MPTSRTLLLGVVTLFLAGCASPAPRGFGASAVGFDLALAEVAPGTVVPMASVPGPALLAFPQDDEDDPSVGHGLLLWIPNRILDLFDIVRARLRVGPGLSFGARATEFADVFIGGYGSFYVGLPGPRGQRTPRWPVGIESKAGAEVSVIDATAEGETFTDAPLYGTYEFGLSSQVVILGFAVGVDPFELVDFVVGLVLFDPADDDF